MVIPTVKDEPWQLLAAAPSMWKVPTVSDFAWPGASVSFRFAFGVKVMSQLVGDTGVVTATDVALKFNDALLPAGLVTVIVAATSAPGYRVPAKEGEPAVSVTAPVPAVPVPVPVADQYA